MKKNFKRIKGDLEQSKNLQFWFGTRGNLRGLQNLFKDKL